MSTYENILAWIFGITDLLERVYAFKDTFGYGLTAKVILSFYEKEG